MQAEGLLRRAALLRSPLLRRAPRADQAPKAAAARTRAARRTGDGGGGCHRARSLAVHAAVGDAIDGTGDNDPPRHVVVCGGGAAGLTAAYFAAECGARVTVLERTKEAGKKILISGGTRCNVLPSSVELERDFFSSAKAGALRQAFATWTLQGARDWLDEVGLDMDVEEETGKVFPRSGSAREVRDLLVRGCLDRGVVLRYNTPIVGLAPQTKWENGGAGGVTNGVDSSEGDTGLDENAPRWVCELPDGEQLCADRVVLATGGYSFPALGTDGAGHRLLKAMPPPMRHTLVEPYPALTPLTGPHPGGARLQGVSLEVDLSVKYASGAKGAKKGKGKRRKAIASNRPGFLFSHKGYSGPAVLDASHHAVMAIEKAKKARAQGQHGGGSGEDGDDGEDLGPLPTVQVNWTGETREEWTARLDPANKPGRSPLVLGRLRGVLPVRLAEALLDEVGIDAQVRRARAWACAFKPRHALRIA